MLKGNLTLNVRFFISIIYIKFKIIKTKYIEERLILK